MHTFSTYVQDQIKALTNFKFETLAFSQKQSLRIQMRLLHRNYVAFSSGWNVYTKQLHRNCCNAFLVGRHSQRTSDIWIQFNRRGVTQKLPTRRQISVKPVKIPTKPAPKIVSNFPLELPVTGTRQSNMTLYRSRTIHICRNLTYPIVLSARIGVVLAGIKWVLFRVAHSTGCSKKWAI